MQYCCLQSVSSLPPGGSKQGKDKWTFLVSYEQGDDSDWAVSQFDSCLHRTDLHFAACGRGLKGSIPRDELPTRTPAEGSRSFPASKDL